MNATSTFRLVSTLQIIAVTYVSAGCYPRASAGGEAASHGHGVAYVTVGDVGGPRTHEIAIPERQLTVRFRDDGKYIALHRAKAEEHRIPPPKGCRWAPPSLSPKHESLFLIAQRGKPDRGYQPHSIYRLGLPEPGTRVDNATAERLMLSEEIRHCARRLRSATIQRIYAVSKDESRLFVLVGYIDEVRSTKNHRYFVDVPFFLDLKTKTLADVVP